MQQLLYWDSQALLWINAHHTPFWDQVMWYATQAWIWIPLYLLLIYVLAKEATTLLDISSKKEFNSPAMTEGGNLKPRQIILLVFVAIACIAAAAGLSDFITSGIIKKWVCRPRPTHSEMAGLLHLVNGYTGGHYGFPSSHAANTMAVAISFWSILNHLRRLPHRVVVHSTTELTGASAFIVLTKLLVIIYVGINCYSRVYLGVHYPLDIICGALFGAFFGYIFALLFKSIYCQPHPEVESGPFTAFHGRPT